MPNQKPIGSLLDQNRAGRRGSHWRIHGCGANTGSEASVLEIQVSDFRPPRRRSGLLGCGGTAVAHFTVQPDRLLLPSFLEKEPKIGAQSQTSRNRISRRLLSARTDLQQTETGTIFPSGASEPAKQVPPHGRNRPSGRKFGAIGSCEIETTAQLERLVSRP
jgi:hypothetical protein